MGGVSNEMCHFLSLILGIYRFLVNLSKRILQSYQ